MNAAEDALVDSLASEWIESLRQRVLTLRQNALDLESRAKGRIVLVHPNRRVAARNLIDYLAVRQTDIRDLQLDLYQTGLSSLGVIEGHVIASLNAVLRVLDRLVRLDSGATDTPSRPAIMQHHQQLEQFADETLGVPLSPGQIRIMVTMPSESAVDADIIESLLSQGMNVMRINCAHDCPETWDAMVKHLEAAKVKVGRECRVAFDLAGSKLRTGPLQPGPEVLRFKPGRDKFGFTVAPVPIPFGPAAAVNDDDELAIVPVDLELHYSARIGDEVRLKDTRGRDRVLPIIDFSERAFLCISDRSTYLATGMELELRRFGKVVASGKIGKLPPSEAAIPLSAGDSLVITRDLTPSRFAVFDDDDETAIEQPCIGCTLPQVFDSIAPGHRIMLDDGKFEGVVREASPNQFTVEITRAGRGQAYLKANKGINLPDTPLDLPALTSKDITDLEHVVRHADLVSISFVHSSKDIDELYRHLERLGAGEVGVVLKIENRTAFERLPELLLTAAKRRRIAVMVARGDLGVEIGFERLAEVQEEILWLCEAAQVPVIWATQVLESLAKKGLPSRGEITDAAMSIRAECVMLNKGPYIAEAIRFLTDVSRRMTQHASKTFATHRALNVAAAHWLEIDPS
jgi:pyruvate kinase